MNAAEWTALVVAAIGAVGAVVVNVVNMILSYKRDMAATEKAEAIRKNTTYIASKTDKLSDKAEIVEKKIDANTKITVKGQDDAIKSAAVAAEAATSAAQKTEAISKKLNGGIDQAIVEGIAPLKKSLDDHAEKDDQNMKVVTDRLNKLEEYVHDKNHKMDGILQGVSAKLTVILQQLGVRIE